MSVMLPSAELLARWAAEELWDWRVRALFALVCAVAVLAVLVVYLAWGLGPAEGEDDAGHLGKAPRDTGRARRYMGRISVALLVLAVAEASYFKEPVSTALLLLTALLIGLIALGQPQGAGGSGGEGRADG